MIPLFKVYMNKNVEEALNPVLHSGYITQGPKVSEFEDAIAKYLDTNYICAVNSGTSALTLAIRLLDCMDSDEILTTPLTCFATSASILENRVNLKWVDVNTSTFMMDMDDLEHKITVHTKAIVVVHWGGTPIDLDRLHEIRDKAEIMHKHKIWIIEDCAHAFGAEYGGRKIGSHGNICAFSFQAIKHLTTGDGGCIVLPSEMLYERAKLLRWYGITRESILTSNPDTRMEQDIGEWGYKFHMNDINATIGLSNLPCVPANLEHARKIAQYYTREFRMIPGLILPKPPNGSVSAYWLYTIQIMNKHQFILYMQNRGIAVSQVHKRNDKHSCVSQYKSDSLSNMDFLDTCMVCIPCGWWVSMEDAKYIVSGVKDWCSQYMRIRPLELEDKNAYFDLLYQLNQYKIELTQNEWLRQYNRILKQEGTIFVMENQSKIIATAKIYVEFKFSQPIGHIEDVVVDKQWRNQGIGSRMIEKLIDFAQKHECYKIILNAKPDLSKFYTRLGFSQNGGEFTMRFHD